MTLNPTEKVSKSKSHPQNGPMRGRAALISKPHLTHDKFKKSFNELTATPSHDRERERERERESAHWLILYPLITQDYRNNVSCTPLTPALPAHSLRWESDVLTQFKWTKSHEAPLRDDVSRIRSMQVTQTGTSRATSASCRIVLTVDCLINLSRQFAALSSFFLGGEAKRGYSTVPVYCIRTCTCSISAALLSAFEYSTLPGSLPACPLIHASWLQPGP
ncbi:hypothetical protein B0H67DRAFT_45371 [Lasiosphaeris hirsuta]|uniref:Uncharacterized protein n=1 Tax=Lasiosphaeris hirsuta TaxID=260670 RepID=A0AA40BAJ4_9PEZI|nr:hypothetical protein B0H67DRAFT_45371 [Lasiosphaeris hirsuta]